MSTTPEQGDTGLNDPGYRVPTTTLPTTAGRTSAATTAPRALPRARESFRSTEFIMTVAFVVLVLLATYVDEDTLARTDGWRYASFAVVAYVISRGLAKLGRDAHRD